MLSRFGLAASADADKGGPYRRQGGADQDVERILAERTAVPAHLDTKATDFMMAGGIEQAR